MDRRHKDLLRRTVAGPRRSLAGGEDACGEWLRGDLEWELDRLGIAADGERTPLSALPGLMTDGARRAQEAALAALEGGWRSCGACWRPWASDAAARWTLSARIAAPLRTRVGLPFRHIAHHHRELTPWIH